MAVVHSVGITPPGPGDWLNALNEFLSSELRARLPRAADPDDVSAFVRPFQASGNIDPLGLVMTTSFTWEMDGEYVAGAFAMHRNWVPPQDLPMRWRDEMCHLIYDMIRHERRRWARGLAYPNVTRDDWRTRHELNCRDWGPNYRLEQDSSQTR